MDLFHTFSDKVLSDIIGLKLTDITGILIIILAILYTIFRIAYDSLKKIIGTIIIQKIQDYTQPSYLRIKNNNSYDIESLFKDYSYVNDNSEGIVYDPKELLYSTRIVLAKKHMIDYGIKNYLDIKAIKVAEGNKDKELMSLIKQSGKLVFSNQQHTYLLQDYHLKSETSCYNRFNKVFSKDNFGLITSGVIKGDIAYVVMIACGASIGAVYDKIIYLECIEIISRLLQEKQRKIELKNLELAKFMVHLISLLLPNNYEANLMEYSLSDYLQQVHIEFLNRSKCDVVNNCIFHNSKYVKLDFDMIEDECYEYIKTVI